MTRTTEMYIGMPVRLRRRAKIPDISVMTEKDARLMLEESRKQVREGNYMTANEMRARIKDEYGYAI